jgi:uncharacterized protein (DUF1778 family)
MIEKKSLRIDLRATPYEKFTIQFNAQEAQMTVNAYMIQQAMYPVDNPVDDTP